MNTVAGLGYFWAITQLLEHHHPNRAKRRQCCVTDRTTFHCKYKEPTELRTDHRSTAAWHDISKVHRKRPDSLSLPHCPSQRGRRLEDCYKAYHITSSSALRQTDPTIHCVSWNLVNYCTTVETSCTVNQSNGLRASHRWTCNKLYVSSHETSPVVGVVNKLANRRVWLIEARLQWWNFLVRNLGQNSRKKYTLISGSTIIFIQPSVK